MSLTQTAHNYYHLGCSTREHMHIRKSEFLTEVILSLFILIIVVQKPAADPSVGVGAIAVIHSFNVARGIEAYKEAKIGTDYEQ